MNNIIIVAEIGINHNGDMDLAKKMIDVANLAELDYVKFQKRVVNSVYTKEFLDSPRESPWGTTQGEQKRGIEFGIIDYTQINSYVRKKDHLKGWFASPWDVKSVAFLNRFDVPYIKVASASITDYELLTAIKESDIPVIISVGMSTKTEVDSCLNLLGNQVEYILACKSTYPTKNEDMNLNFIRTLKEEYPRYRIGFSNHSAGIQMCLAAAVLGAEMIEFHMTLDRSMYGSDQSASIETTGVLKIGKHIRSLEQAMGTGNWTITPEEEKIREKLRK